MMIIILHTLDSQDITKKGNSLTKNVCNILI